MRTTLTLEKGEWLACEAAWIPLPAERHTELFGRLCELPWMTARLVPDAHLAALALEHGLTVCSTDGDFSKFPDVTWLNPVTAKRI